MRILQDVIRDYRDAFWDYINVQDAQGSLYTDQEAARIEHLETELFKDHGIEVHRKED